MAKAEAGGDDTRCVRLSAERAQVLLADVDTLLFDCDGVLWRGEAAVPGAPEALTALRARGKRLGFITNNSSKTRSAYAEKLQRLGFGGPAGPGAGLEVFGTAYCTALYLRQRLAGLPAPKAYVLGSPALAAELEAVGVASVGVGPAQLQGDGPCDWLAAPLEPDVRAVVVGFDPHFSYMKLTQAVRYLQQPGCLLVGTNMDNRLPLENGRYIAGPCAPGAAEGEGRPLAPFPSSDPGCSLSPSLGPAGTGCLVRAVEMASQRQADIIGKPSRFIFDCVSQEYGINPERTVMVGDRLDTDILLGVTCGLKTILTLTGVSTLEDVKNNQESDCMSKKKMVPDYYVDSVADLLPALQDTQGCRCSYTVAWFCKFSPADPQPSQMCI
ncbi:glycerol-3-phosphate phosphatase isoform X1 [Loxodonta africana]|uniref:glycerol-3-phosphate phosphatase isoform X1 n=1 Tax=Loxodonta africana TaxID=9785 RepID=UPI000C81117A|nr:glycerol-3-phosphate phosphatase isoform X1 [Loxodonta africana]